MKFKNACFIVCLSALVGACGGSEEAESDAAGEPIKVGVLHSLSGSMAISETTLKDTIEMMVDEQNARGGLLGRQLEAVVVDPASDWPLFAERARELLESEQVDVVFGCWTSVSRKSVLPVFEELNGLLFYPVQYEGEESSRNVIYTGAAPNQQAIPAVDYLANEVGIERWVLEGTDYVYPRTTNRILEAYLKEELGVADEDISINYTPFSHSDWQTRVSEIRDFGSEGKRTAVVSTINGDANVPFYLELANQEVSAEDIPVVAFSVGEEELSGLDTTPLVGHLAAWNYFQSIEGAENSDFIANWKQRMGADRTTNDPMEAHFIGFNMWETPNLTGGSARWLPNHHLTKPVFIGEVRADGQFDVVWQTDGLVEGDAWTDFLPGSRDTQADWVELKCGNYNTQTGVCSTTNFE